ncbi:MAG: hypothetical protein H6833_07145 [Planctomycetes bacterium]|nr:hypothetical protein [Planctomycetota bacterium]
MYRLVLAGIVLFGIAGCSTLEHANLRLIEETTNVALSMDETPDGCVPIGMVYSEQSGFYLFGVLPMPSVTLDKCLRGLAMEATKIDADGVSQIRMQRETPAFFSFGTPPFPWMAWIQMQGMAYARVDSASGSNDRPGVN